MTDVLERLRAANPVSGCPQPDWDDVLRRLTDCPAPAPRRRQGVAGLNPFLRAGLVVAALGAALAVSLVAGRGGEDISLVQRAYAATNPAGGILYYLASTRSSFGSGAGASGFESRIEVWRDGSRSRRVETLTTHLPGGQAQRGGAYEQVNERTAGGETSTSYSSRTNTIFKGSLTFTGETSPESIDCTSAPACSFTTEDPLLALRRLYAAGRVHETGQEQLNGQTVTVLEVKVRRTPPTVLQVTGQRILVDAKTGAPVELVTHYGRQARALISTTVFHAYRHLELTPQTERLLTITSHPHAHIECVPALHCPAK